MGGRIHSLTPCGYRRAQRLVIGLVGAMFIMLVELLVFVMRSLKADEVLEAARQVSREMNELQQHMCMVFPS